MCENAGREILLALIFGGYTVRSIYGGGSLYASKFHITQPVAEFIDLWLGDKVDSSIELLSGPPATVVPVKMTNE